MAEADANGLQGERAAADHDNGSTLKSVRMPPRAVQLEATRRFSFSIGGAACVAATLLSVVAAVALAACADGGAPPASAAAPPTGCAVLVRLPPAVDAAAPGPALIAAWASAGAGVPAVYVAAGGGAWHALSLRSPAVGCDAARQRLADDRAHFDSVERDALRRAAAR